MFETTNSKTQGSMNFVENTKIGVNEQKYFHSNLSEWGDMFNYLMISYLSLLLRV
jgi:hypothetical protein